MMFKWLVWGYLKAPRLSECYLFRITQSQLNSSLIIQGFFSLQIYTALTNCSQWHRCCSEYFTGINSFNFNPSPHFTERSLNSGQVKYLDLAFRVDEWHRDILSLSNLAINYILSKSSILSVIVCPYEMVTLTNENGMFSSFNEFAVL